MEKMKDETETGSGAARLILYWTVVGIPLVWGIWTTALKLKALFG